MTRLRYIYSIGKNYIEMTLVKVIDNGKEIIEEFEQMIFVPFAPTRINPIQGNFDGKSNQLIGISVMSNNVNLCNITKFNENGEKNVENEFLLINNGEKIQKSFDEMVADFLNHTGFTDSSTKPNMVQWGEIDGMLSQQTDLNSVLDQKSIKQISFVIDHRNQYESEIMFLNKETQQWEPAFKVNCKMMTIDFGSFAFNPNFKYTILIDRYRSKRMKKVVQYFDEKGNWIGQTKKYVTGKFTHESQLDCQTNRRINEIGIDVEKLKSLNNKWTLQFEQHNYFSHKSFPKPTGNDNGSLTKHLSVRLRIENETSMIETDSIGTFDLVGYWDRVFDRRYILIKIK